MASTHRAGFVVFAAHTITGTTTGISAADRAITARRLLDPSAEPARFTAEAQPPGLHAPNDVSNDQSSSKTPRTQENSLSWTSERSRTQWRASPDPLPSSPPTRTVYRTAPPSARWLP
ncbi:MAG: 3,4-dihydroxy-2-butanone-4-phosphate synthase [Rhodococcus sp. (in: high G+C Gram-positive bacteria)]|uniref:3,4-dihydroxy-2-butanone-4-phosphate synthase n=1 Tax=Rhodococcus sp. EPR-157 TaxID=1813677 RepID=UPI001E474E97|nr:3,4-dihydroxy-2-butanone-4-phosphate synthase [Rhodococcus sp. EPR-157]